ncbi:MAG: hypothetical protein ACYC4J_00385 [Gemmatimonadaceae bacterium]
MADEQVRRIPIVDERGALVGIVSHGLPRRPRSASAPEPVQLPPPQRIPRRDPQQIRPPGRIAGDDPHHETPRARAGRWCAAVVGGRSDRQLSRVPRRRRRHPGRHRAPVAS